MSIAASVPYSSTCTEWSITRSTGWSGLILDALPPSFASASRMAARSTTQGTPVKSCSSTRAVRNAISLSTRSRTFHVAIARTSAALTKAPSSFRRRFSRRILSENGSLATELPGTASSASRRYTTYDSPSTASDARDLKLLRDVMAQVSESVSSVFGRWSLVFGLPSSIVSLLLDSPLHRHGTDVPFEHRHLNRVGRALVDEITIGARPLERRFEHVRLAFGVHRHLIRRERDTERAADAPVADDRKLDRAPGVHAAGRAERVAREVERVVRGRVARVEHPARGGEAEPVVVPHGRPHEQERRSRPRGELRHLQRPHHRLRGAHVDRREALLLDAARRGEARAPDVDADHGVHSPHGHRVRQVVDHAAVGAGAPLYHARREEPRQRARRVHRVGHLYLLQSWQSPDQLGAALEVDGVHEQRHLERAEGAGRHDVAHPRVERPAEVERRQIGRE